MELLKRSLPFAVVAVVCAGACRPDLDQRASRVTSSRVLAVRADPAEVEPRDPVSFSVLMVDPQGAVVANPPASWAFCSARKPLAELGPVSPACYGHGEGTLTGIGAGA